jgi:hypothetical protein
MKYPSFSAPQGVLEHFKLQERAGYNLAPLQLEDLTTAGNWDRLKWFYEVGVGKTVCSTVHAMMMGMPLNIIIVPPILIPQWGKWLRRVDPESVVLEYCGPPSKRKLMQPAKAKWIIVSHAIYRDDFERLFKDLAKLHPHVIVDEAHALKSAQSQLFRKVNTMTQTGGLQLLTGTPTSKPGDAYAYVKLTTPSVYRSWGHFEQLHVAERDFFGTITKWQNLDLARQNLNLQACRRTKDEMFPGIVKPRYETIDYQLAPAHAKLYKKLAEEQLLLLDTGEKIDATTVQRMYHALQQIIVNFDHYSGDQTARAGIYDWIDHTIDQTQCMDRSRSKLIIWTYYKLTTRSILGYLEDFGAVGAYSEANSAKSVKAFMEDPGCRILVAQPMSAGMGLEPQHVCCENLFVEYSTVPLHFTQSVGRTDRKGQKHMPTFRVACAQDTIQVPLLQRLLHNGDLVQQTEGLRESIRQAVFGQA